MAAFDAPLLAFPDSVSITSLGDFNDDGHLDALGWYWSHSGLNGQITVRSFLNDGTGVFTVSGSAGGHSDNGALLAWDTEVGKFAGGTRDGWISIFEEDVNVTLYDANGWANTWQQWSEPFPVEDSVVADFDNDGFDDVALIGAELKLYRSDGTSLQLAASYPIAGKELKLGEFNGDGSPDLLVAEPPYAQVLYVNGTSSITAGPRLAHGIFLGEGAMHCVGDVDNDGDDDVVVFAANGQYVTARRTGTTTFAIESRAIGGPATGFADIDGDGDLDGVCCGGGGGPSPARNTMPSTYHVSINQGGGNFQVAHTIPGFGAFRLAGAEDIDGDGDKDLVGGRTILFNQGTFGVDPAPDLSASLPDRFAVYDQDRDGDDDVVEGYGIVHRNDGSGDHTVVAPLRPRPPSGTTFRGVGYHGDFDGDGAVDVILGHVQGASVLGMRLLRNSGGGDYVDAGYASPVRFSNSTDLNDFGERSLVFDVDNDGDQDIVVGHYVGLIVNIVWRNDGTGQFTRGPQFFGGVPMRAHDFDKDGNLDIVSGTTVYFGNGAGGFVRGIMPSSTWIDTRRDVVGIGDLDRNGLDDLVALSRSGGDLQVLWSEGGRTFTRTTHAVNGSNSSGDARYAHVVDLNGDGLLDVVAYPTLWYDGDNAILLFSDGGRNFPTQAVQVVEPRQLADVDGDGDLDAIGSSIARLALKNVPADGYRRQYGRAVAGLGGMAPTLGAVGPFESPGAVELRISGTPGGAFVTLGLGASESALADWPFPGLTAYALPLLFTIGMLADGASGAAGAGCIELPIAVPPGLGGVTVFHQAWVWDPSTAMGVTQTNGLEVRYR